MYYFHFIPKIKSHPQNIRCNPEKRTKKIYITDKTQDTNIKYFCKKISICAVTDEMFLIV